MLQTIAEQGKCREMVDELKQQIAELSFYLKTQHEVDQSPQKHELQQVMHWTAGLLSSPSSMLPLVACELDLAATCRVNFMSRRLARGGLLRATHGDMEPVR